MIMKKLLLTVFFFFLVFQLLWPSGVISQELPKGVSVVKVSEHEVNTPGVSKVVLFKITMEPGSAWENIPVAHTEL